ncbi:MAG: chorismate mutase [Pseudomonadota bacterium]
MTEDLIPRTSPDACSEMSEVRYEIDRLDRVLVRLMAERQAYIEAAGRIKERSEDVRLEWRIEDVVAKVLAAAEREGLSKRIAEPVWRALIDRCIDHEHAIWARVHAKEQSE